MKQLIILTLFSASSIALAANRGLACPPAIEVRQDPQPVEGWLAHDGQAPHRFYFAQFSDGPPSRQAILLHDREARAGKDQVLVYEFLDAQEPWLICSYTGTSAVLARRLAPGTRACRLTLDHARNFEAVKEISCRE